MASTTKTTSKTKSKAKADSVAKRTKRRPAGGAGLTAEQNA